MSRRGAARMAFAGIVLALAASVGLVSIRESRDQLAVIEACDAAQQGDSARAVELAAPRVGPSETGRGAAECLCRALLAQGRGDECTAQLEAIWRAPEAAEWLPAPDLAAHAIAARRAEGRAEEAADLARRAGVAYPHDPHVFSVELDARANVEAERTVLRELALRLPAEGADAAGMRATLAQRYLRAGDAAEALAVLGGVPPPRAGAALSVWFDTRAIAHAMADDLAGVRRTMTAWREAGGDPVELRARYALALSISGLRDPERDTASLLRDALRETASQSDPVLREGLVIRLVMTLASARKLDEALQVYDRHRDEISGDGLTREELVRAVRQQKLEKATASERLGTLRFRIAPAPEGAVLAVSREGRTDEGHTETAEADVDAAYETLRVPESGTLEVERSEGDAPIRWVLRAEEHRLASGTVSPIAGEVRSFDIRPREPVAPAPLPKRARRRGDGRRRVAIVMLDCGDWRLVRYLRERGELPLLGALLRDGHRAVLDSDPPLTAAALEALVWPMRHSDASLLGLVHRMGVELAGLASVGDNPFRALSWVLPESDDFFSVIGAGPHSAANLLLAHGGIRAGRHGEVSGPNGVRRRLPVGRVARDLQPDERRRFPALAAAESERDRLYIRTIAAELDATQALLEGNGLDEDGLDADDLDAGTLDLVMVRVEPLDILTHANFSHIVADGQDDGEGLLFSVYRYIDARLAALDAALDSDDVLIVMSDHGIRTAMQHSRDAFFVAAGGGIPRGRAAGRPALRGVSRAVADLLSVETDWPDTGVAPWSMRRNVASRAASPDPPRGR